MGRWGTFIRTRADWVSVLEALHSSGGDERAWSESVAAAAKVIFPNAVSVGIYSVEHDPARVPLRVLSCSPMSVAPDALRALPGKNTFDPFHYPPCPVMTTREILRGLGPEMTSAFEQFGRGQGFVDALGIVSHPAPGLVTVLTALSDRPIELAPYERRLLMRVALHMDAGYRVRRHPESVMAELTADGRVLSRSNDAPPAARLEAHAAFVRESRSRLQRSDAGAVELWSAMLAGRVTLAPRIDGASRARYVVLDNPPAVHSLRALTPAEAAVLAMAARGVSTKLIAYGLGIGSSAVSTRLASAAAKIGVMSRADLVRVAAILARDPRADLQEPALTAAEHEILDGLQRGLSNRELAAERSRSVRTIANQVASLLRKTASPSRRALIARVPRPA